MFYNNKNSTLENELSSEEAIDQVQDNVIVDEPPVRIMEGQVLGIKNEIREWLIEAESISIAEDRESTLFKNIKQMVIYKDEEPHLTISADEVLANMQTKDMELSGNVVISNQEGNSLKGQKIYWHSEEQSLSSDSEIELYVDDNYIIAGGIYSNMEMTEIELIGRATVTMKL
ncbi:MAG: LPS export ABC transporter periplasmic protein LptC [Atribacterota bacterium]|nr:LPS export ABC transporter periplasmic protein LptC [Atribacterota bacterium]